MQNSDYEPDSLTKEYATWPWYIDYLRYVDLEKQGNLPAAAYDYADQSLPVDVGVKFGEWVLQVTEVRDLVYDRFVKGNFDDEVAGNLLSFATAYFLYANRIKGGSGLLAICWRPIAQILSGEMESVFSNDYRNELLKSSFAFHSESTG